MTGSGQYLHELWRGLHALGGDNEYRLIGHVSARDTPPTDILPSPNTLLPVWWRWRPAAVRALEERTAGLLARNADLRKIWNEQAGLVNAARAAADMNAPLDVLHVPYWAAPLLYKSVYGRTPGVWRDQIGGRAARPALVVTVHDLIPLVMPQYAPALKHRLYFRLVAAATRNADLVLADSEHSRQDVLRLLKLPAERVVAVPLGVAQHLAPVSDPHVLADFRARYNLGDAPLIGYLGGFDVRKNVGTLIRAFARALPHLPGYRLVIAGKLVGNDPTIYPDLRVICREVGVAYTEGSDESDAPVRFIGVLPEADKPAFYSVVQMYAFPSRYEGFGLPPLEALACGAAVLTTDSSSIPEVVGDAARTLPSDDVAVWARALVEVGTDAALRQHLRAAGPVQAAKFTWERTARRTAEMYGMAESLRTRGRS